MSRHDASIYDTCYTARAMQHDLTHVALVLFLAFIGGLVLQYFRQPRLIGYILVGALIGPGVLGLQADDPTIHWLAELGIILLMFMLGLELDIGRFRKAMRAALWVAGLQILASLALMLCIGVFLEWPWERAIILGFAAALSSTAVAMSVLRDLGEVNSSAGRLSIAILIAQDLAVIPMLLTIGILRDGAISFDDITSTAFALIAIALSLFGIFELQRHPRWLARIERLLTAGRQQAVIAGLALCFGAAALSGWLGLSTAYGAFALGLLIGNLGESGASYRHAVGPLHDLLLMVFFLSVGLLLDIRFVVENTLLIATLLLAVVTLKTLGNFVILRFLQVPYRTAFIMGATLGQIGEFSFVLIALGLAGGFITQESYQIALAVIALSLALSPAWLSLVRARLHIPVH